MSYFEVIKSGILTLIQDRGRFSYTNLGVCNSGFMDEYAALMAHKLLNNSIEDNLLEIVFGNIELKASDDTNISVCGAKCDFYINDILYDTWQSFNIKKNDIIKITKIHYGTRVYLAVKNGFDIKKELGSNSTSIKEKLGGINGNKISNKDVLNYKKQNKIIKHRLQKKFIPKYKEKVLALRVLLSYQMDTFSKAEKEKFFSSTFTITNDFNAMACKLKGEKISSSINGIISEGICFGAIQIPSDGQPIILLKERQTIGGYPKIGSVLAIDCFKLAQLKPNQLVNFKIINEKEAVEKTKSFYNIFQEPLT